MKTKSRENGEGTFKIQIQYCENATWQGVITWADKKVSQHFRSELELLSLMEQALDASEEQKEKVK